MQQYNEFEAEYREPEKNVLGIVGFALSFCTGPIGLIISLIALGKRPRGFAIAGVIISLISSVVLGLVGWFVFWAGSLGIKAAEATLEMKAVRSAVKAYQSANQDQLPSDLSGLSLTAEQTTDPWGTAYRLQSNPDGTWAIVSASLDTTFDTVDDLVMTADMSDAEIQTEIQEKMGKYYENKFGR